MSFAHLHLHDTYSLLDGYGTPEFMAKRCAELDMIALGETNHGSIAGHIAHMRACKAASIYPVFGCEFYLSDDMDMKGLTEEQEKEIELKAANKSEAEKMRKEKVKDLGDRSHLLVLAMSGKGYANLRSLVSASYLRGFYRKPRIDYEILKSMSEGIFVSTACQIGDLPRMILNNDMAGAEKFALDMNEAFPGRFALEIMPLDTREQRVINSGIHVLATKLKIPVIATNDVHYILREDAWAQDVLLAIGTNKAYDDETRMRFGNGELFLRSEQEMLAAFKQFHPDLPELFVQSALNNAYEIAFQCKANPLETVAKLPPFKVPDGFGNGDEFLRFLCAGGWKRRGFADASPDVQKTYGERVKYELEILRSKGFANYFLIVWDMVKWAKDHGISVGPARGSSAGSLVAYLLGITDINPLRFGLSFERFIAPHRKDWPDIDVDFEDIRRGEVKDYLGQKYGPDCVANVATFNMLQFRSAFRDAARVFKVPQAEVDRAIGFFASDSIIDDEVDVKFENQEFTRKYPNVVKAANALQGQIRAGGTHAAGVVLADRPLAEVTSMEVHGNTPVVALTKDEAEALGLVKIDLLGLRTMTVFSWALTRINERRAREGIEKITVEDIISSLNDPAVFAEFAAGNTEAVFQFNKPGGKRLCVEVKISCFNDLSAVNALDRPGPLDSGGTDSYIHRKRGEPVPHAHPVFDAITKDTFGVLLYQEQVMRLCRELAGLDWPDVHAIRKTIAKSQGQEAVEEFWPKFKAGALSHECSETTARWIWDQIITHGRYSFNLSHAVSYAAIGYASMWLKLYYPKEYLCAVMEFGANPREAVIEARKRGIQVLEPDINRSGIGFTLGEEGIYSGLDSVKGVGPEAANAIILARGERPFVDFNDFRARASGRKVHKGIVRSLIEVGAFESLHPNTIALLDYANKTVVEKDRLDLFSGEPAPAMLGQRVKLSDTLLMKRVELLPFIPQHHPGLEFDDVLAKFDKLYPSRTQIEELREAGRARTRNEIRTITGILTKGEMRTGDMGSPKKTALLSLEDESGEIVVRMDPKRFPTEADRFCAGNAKVVVAVVSPISEYRADVREIADLVEFRKEKLSDSMTRLLEAPGRAVLAFRQGRISKTLRTAARVKSPLVIGLAMRIWEGKTRATGEAMGFVDLADESDQQIVLLWPQTWAILKDELIEGHIYEAKLGTTKDSTLCCDVTRGQYFHDLTPGATAKADGEDVPFPPDEDLPF